jgi:hypothetical protein
LPKLSHTRACWQELVPIGGKVGVFIGAIDGVIIGQIVGGHIGGKSIEFSQSGRIWPFTHWHTHSAFADAIQNVATIQTAKTALNFIRISGPCTIMARVSC